METPAGCAGDRVRVDAKDVVDIPVQRGDHFHVLRADLFDEHPLLGH